MAERRGPLASVKVVEFAGLGPAPFAAMLLADMGADVVRIDRPGAPDERLLARGKRSIALDLKGDGTATALDLIGAAELAIEGFRPGVMERLGLGPDAALARNPRLVYGRMTGWGQHGPLAHTAGHDLTYLALSGALHAIGPADRPPPPPLNLVADFGGGSLYLVMGLLAALTHARATGEGQVVDAAMTDGAASLTGLFHQLLRVGRWVDRRGANPLDGAAPFYRCYACADGKWLAVAALEPRFWALFRERVGLADPLFARQHDQDLWPEQAGRVAAVLATRTRDEWCALLEGTDACAAPVLSLTEAPLHPHNIARATFTAVDGGYEPAPAPRFSAAPPFAPADPPATDSDREAVLRDWLGR